MSDYEAFDVTVPGGALRVGRWAGAPDRPPVLAVHGVTANHLCWLALGAATPLTVVAPDLRGRGRSSALTGPAGLDAHVADLVAVLDHLGVERAVVVGHSMGGFVAAALADAHPDRVAATLLVDGGLPLPPVPEGVTIDEALAATIGPASDRLSMTFADEKAYLDFWRPHPALAPIWSPQLETYFAYDLVGEPPELRCSPSVQAVREDSVDILDTAAVARRASALPAGTTFLRAERGMLDQPDGLYAAERVAELTASYPAVAVRTVPGVNHYSITMGEHGAAAVAQALAATPG